MNKVLEINDINQTARVQPGLMGPDFEIALNKAPERFSTNHRYTCGHFPQSFEISSVGGWVVTLGSGQASTYYGDVYDIVLSQEYVTPSGTFKTMDYPSTATGPKANDIMKGSEGTYGVLVEVTMKIFRFMPEHRQRFAYMFSTWDDAVQASREISQAEFGMPAVFRILDPDETEVGLKLFNIHGTFIDKTMTRFGYKPMQRCLCLGTAEGHKVFSKNVKKQVSKICRKKGALPLSGYPIKKWEHTRYKEVFMREDLHDYGILSDTLETSVTWDNIHNLHKGVCNYIKQYPEIICMSHASHFYPQGTNLYFIFIMKQIDVVEYKKFHRGILDTILKHGGSMSHHHGVGKMIAPWMEAHLGQQQIDILKALKKHFDPNNIMNPGTLITME